MYMVKKKEKWSRQKYHFIYVTSIPKEDSTHHYLEVH